MKTVQEIADIYGVTIQTVYRWVKDGLPTRTQKLAGRKPRIIIQVDDVEAYFRSKER